MDQDTIVKFPNRFPTTLIQQTSEISEKELRNSNPSGSGFRNKKHQSMNFVETKNFISDLTKTQEGQIERGKFAFLFSTFYLLPD